MIVKFIHHGVEVSGFDHLRGKHREYCLCFQGCINFKPEQPDNCVIAQATYENCVKFDTVTPVFECPKFSLDTVAGN